MSKKKKSENRKALPKFLGIVFLDALGGGLGGISLGEIKNIKVVFDNAVGKEDRAIKNCPVVGFKFENENGFLPGSIVVKR